jgi:hypothetical protein
VSKVLWYGAYLDTGVIWKKMNKQEVNIKLDLKELERKGVHWAFEKPREVTI